MYYVLSYFALPPDVVICQYNGSFSQYDLSVLNYKIINMFHTKIECYDYVEKLIGNNELKYNFYGRCGIIEKSKININSIKIIEEHDIFDNDLNEILNKQDTEKEIIENRLRRIRIDVVKNYSIKDDILSIYYFNENEKLVYDGEYYTYDNLPPNLKQIIIYEYTLDCFGEIRRQNINRVNNYFKKIPFGCVIKNKIMNKNN